MLQGLRNSGISRTLDEFAALEVSRVDDDNTPAIAVEKTHDVIVKNLTVQGGLYGILVDFSRSVQITSSAVLDSSRAGIRASSSSIDVEYSEIAHVRSPYGMGIELANTVDSGDSMLVRNTIHDIPLAGIDMHNSNAMIERNSTQHNGLCGITIAEMSMAMVNSNLVSGNDECGI
jgi:Right handed beta helix region